MMKLPTPLAPLAAYRQFLVCKFIPKSNGKTDKIPVSVETLEAVNPHDPRHWTDADTACAMVDVLGPEYGLAFTFTTTDPFWFVDIDNCLTPANSWSDLAVSVMNLLPGAAIEISQSGKGLHIFGIGDVPPHGCKNIELGLEFYTEGRFVALTGTNAVGDAGTDCSASLPTLVDTFFPAPAHLDQDVTWTTGPVAEWAGPADDEELIERAKRSQSMKNKIGKAASFIDLWECRTDMLSQFYPSEDRLYDASSADAALAQHLAFWTGKDCERIRRLMSVSALVRDKWGREDYLPRTILSAIAKQKDVYKERSTKVPTTNAISDDIRSEVTSGLQFLAPQQQQQYFAHCVYVRHHHKIWVPDGSMLTPAQFKASYGGYIFSLDNENEKTTKDAWEAFTLSQAIRFPKVANTCFRPELSTGSIIVEEGVQLVNTYSPIHTESKEGDIGPFIDHCKKLFPDDRDREIILTYMAAMVQNPGHKFQWCPLIQGTEGNGKTLLASVLAHCVGHRYTHTPNASDLGGNGSKFTGWLAGKLFISLEEIYVSDRREVTEALKPLITNSRVEIQNKGADQYTGDNRANWMLFSNHKDAIHVSVDGRRYCIFYTAQQTKAAKVRDGMGGAYFPRLYDWLRNGGFAAVNHYLQHRHLTEEFNPAGLCQEAPATTSTDEALRLSLGTVEQNVLEAIDEGRPGFRGGWISSKAFDKLLEEIRASSRVPVQKRRGVLQALGYDWHPVLYNGRVNTTILQEGGKPRLYVKDDHPVAVLATPAGVLARYMKDQGYVDGGVNTDIESSLNKTPADR